MLSTKDTPTPEMSNNKHSNYVCYLYYYNYLRLHGSAKIINKKCMSRHGTETWTFHTYTIYAQKYVCNE